MRRSNYTPKFDYAAWCREAEKHILNRLPQMSGKIDWDTVGYMGKYLHLSPEDAAIRYCDRYA